MATPNNDIFEQFKTVTRERDRLREACAQVIDRHGRDLDMLCRDCDCVDKLRAALAKTE